MEHKCTIECSSDSQESGRSSDSEEDTKEKNNETVCSLPSNCCEPDPAQSLMVASCKSLAGASPWMTPTTTGTTMMMSRKTGTSRCTVLADEASALLAQQYCQLVLRHKQILLNINSRPTAARFKGDTNYIFCCGRRSSFLVRQIGLENLRLRGRIQLRPRTCCRASTEGQCDRGGARGGSEALSL